MSEKSLDLESIKAKLARALAETGATTFERLNLYGSAPTDIAALVAEVEKLRSRLNEEMELSLVLSEHLDSRNSEVARLRDGG